MWGKSAQAGPAGVGREDRDSKERVCEVRGIGVCGLWVSTAFDPVDFSFHGEG